MKHFHVRRGAYWIVMSLFLTVAGCGGDSGTGNGDDGNGNGTGNGGGNDGGNGNDPVATMEVTIRDFSFNPASILVSSGATVTWTWMGVSAHNVTFASSQVATPSATKATGTFQVAMPTAAGEYAYQCTIHPNDMNGTVTVQ